MDELKLGNTVLTEIVSSVIEKAIHKEFGCDVNLTINDLHATVIDGRLHVSLDAVGDMEAKHITKFIKR